MADSLYIHVPFCRAKCAYCDFYSLRMDDGLALRYVDALRAEAGQRASGAFGTVFIGGGTPSVLPPGSIGSVLECVGEHAHIADNAEVSVEANPESMPGSLVEELLEAGVTRLSVGVQSLVDEELITLERSHNSIQAIEALQGLSGSGLDISIDLMYSIPGQTLQSWDRTLGAATGLNPSHISAYELTLEQGTPMYEKADRGKLQVIREEESLAMYHEARKALSGSGYEHYEVSNYALPGKRSRHNMSYWRRREYTGLGPGAVSYKDGKRTRNHPDVVRYCEALEHGALPPFEQEVLSSDDASREFLMLGLRTSDGVSLEEALHVYGLLSLESSATPFLDGGLLLIAGGRLRLSEDKGFPLMNTVLVHLFSSLGI